MQSITYMEMVISIAFKTLPATTTHTYSLTPIHPHPVHPYLGYKTVSCLIYSNVLLGRGLKPRMEALLPAILIQMTDVAKETFTDEVTLQEGG